MKPDDFIPLVKTNKGFFIGFYPSEVKGWGLDGLMKLRSYHGVCSATISYFLTPEAKFYIFKNIKILAKLANELKDWLTQKVAFDTYVSSYGTEFETVIRR